MSGTAQALAGRIHVHRDRFELDVDLAVPTGGRLAVIGPNGSGKSTLLGAIAGLVSLSRKGTVTLFGQPLCNIPLEERRIGFFAQDGLLFPHLTVVDNVAFATGLPRAAARKRAGQVLHEFAAERLASAMPQELSGGERQRVALARALAADPRLLVLDEPFAALDVTASAELRELVAQVAERHRLTLVFATHDLVDAVRLADDVLVLESGRVIEQLSVSDLQTHPRSEFAAEFAGLARLRGEVRGGVFRCASGSIPVTGRLIGQVLDAEALLLVPPDAVELAHDAAAADWNDRVVSLIGDRTEVLAQLASGLRMRLPSSALLTPGSEIPIRIRTGELVAVSQPAA